MTGISDYIHFWQEYESELKIEGQALCFIFQNRQLLVKFTETSIQVPTRAELVDIQLDEEESFYLGRLKDVPCFLVNVLGEVEAPEGCTWMGLREECWLLDCDLYSVSIKAQQLLGWDKTSQYCGSCGAKNTRKSDERAKLCPKCGRIEYPRISPAIIVAVKKDDKVLMAHNAGFEEGLYGVIAGFVEQGESLEEAVRREVYEEVGIKIKNIKYFESRPWINSDSLMLGFTADYESGEIQIDGKEITAADWFSKDHLPPRIPLKITTARALIDYVLDLE